MVSISCRLNISSIPIVDDRVDIGSCAAGQSSALIHDIKGAGEVVNEVIAEAEEILPDLIHQELDVSIKY